MAACRILALARTIRCASVVGLVRKAWAMASVVSPHTSRRVSATRASGDRVGWQQVKISRSRASSISSASWSPAKCVDGLEAAGRNQPGARVGGNTLAWPLLHRHSERVVQRILGQVEIAQQSYQGGEDPPRLLPVEGVHPLAHGLP